MPATDIVLGVWISRLIQIYGALVTAIEDSPIDQVKIEAQIAELKQLQNDMEEALDD